MLLRAYPEGWVGVGGSAYEISGANVAELANWHGMSYRGYTCKIYGEDGQNT